MQPPSPSRLFAELTRLSAEFQANSGIACTVTLDERHTRFEEKVGEVLYRAVRELLTNVQRHAKATSVEVATALRKPSWVEISVTDNGIGFSSDRRKLNPLDEGAIGLWSIDQRLAAFGGVLEIRSQPGTRATIVVPVAWLLS